MVRPKIHRRFGVLSPQNNLERSSARETRTSVAGDSKALHNLRTIKALTSFLPIKVIDHLLAWTGLKNQLDRPARPAAFGTCNYAAQSYV